jgi:hypothetical protein
LLPPQKKANRDLAESEVQQCELLSTEAQALISQATAAERESLDKSLAALDEMLNAPQGTYAKGSAG